MCLRKGGLRNSEATGEVDIGKMDRKYQEIRMGGSACVEGYGDVLGSAPPSSSSSSSSSKRVILVGKQSRLPIFTPSIRAITSLRQDRGA